MPTSTALTPDQFQQVMPAKMKGQISPQLMDQINTTLSDPILLERFKDNLIGFSSVMQKGKFKLSQYICAVKFIGFKLMGDTNIDAYEKTFSNKCRDMRANGTSHKQIVRYASSYNSTKLVTLIFEQTMMPVYVSNAPLFQQALNVQADLMMNANSEKVRTDAASSLLTHLKPPETQKIELDVGIKEDDSIKQLRATTLALARQQQLMIEEGSASVGGVAGSKLLGADKVEEAEIV